MALPRAAAAQAGEDEVFVTAGAEYAAEPDFRAGSRGVGGSVAAFWGANRWLAIGGMGSYAHHFVLPSSDGSGASNVFGAFAGASFTLDVLEVVPFISVMPGTFLSADGVTPSLRGALGVDYRPSRRWALGADIAWHATLDAGNLTFPGHSVVRLRVSYIFDLRAL